MARMRPVLFSSTTTVPCTTGRTRSSARAAALPLPSVTRTKHHVVERELALARSRCRPRAAGCARRQGRRAKSRPSCRPASPPPPPASSARRRAAAAHSRAPAARPAACRCVLGVGLDPLHGLGEVGLGAAELHAAGAALVARQAFLQRLLHRPLQLRIDGRAHRVGIGRDRIDAGNRLGLARDLIDEMEADVAARPLDRRPCAGSGGNPRLRLFGGDRLPSSRMRLST